MTGRFFLLVLPMLVGLMTRSAWCAQAVEYRSAPKFALVVGNDRYGEGFRLRNAGRDAELVAARLRAAGYVTRQLGNADRATLLRELGTFASSLGRGGVGAFYYAGHGLQIKGRNYLIPTDAPLNEPERVAGASLGVDYLIERVRTSGAHLSIVLLDACRNEPGLIGPRYRGAEAGFAAAQPANGMVIAYATQPGERALDGSGNNGPFALALANWLTRPGVPIEIAMKHVMTEVRASTRDEQAPWVASSMVGSFAVVPAPGARAQLFLPAPGASTGLAVRGRSPEESGSSATATAGGMEMLQWFQQQSSDAQMLLTREIEQKARLSGADDVPRLLRQARRGSVMAQATLGTAYRDGVGLAARASNNSAARRWLGMAAQQRLPYALNALGEMHYTGQGDDRNLQQARAYFNEAASLGYIPAKLNLVQVQLDAGARAEAMLDLFKIQR